MTVIAFNIFSIEPEILLFLQIVSILDIFGATYAAITRYRKTPNLLQAFLCALLGWLYMAYHFITLRSDLLAERMLKSLGCLILFMALMTIYSTMDSTTPLWLFAFALLDIFGATYAAITRYRKTPNLLQAFLCALLGWLYMAYHFITLRSDLLAERMLKSLGCLMAFSSIFLLSVRPDARKDLESFAQGIGSAKKRRIARSNPPRAFTGARSPR